jgi:FkbM family methyltransferase
MKTKVLNIIRRVFMIPVVEKILAGLTRGKSPSAFISRFPPSHFLYPSNSIRNVIRDGIYYRLDLSDAVDWYIYYGFRETSRMEFYKLVGRGAVVLDIGANVGDVTLHSSKIAGAEGRILAFEPDPENFQRLTTNLKLNNFQNVKAFNFGFGNVPGKYRMALFRKDNKGMTRIVGDDANGTYTDVQITTLDDFSSGMEFPAKVNLVKIDVEGFETNVLKGATAFLKKYRPVLFIELVDNHLKLQNTSAVELVSLLEHSGYKMHHSETGESITSQNNFSGCHYDLVAVPV